MRGFRCLQLAIEFYEVAKRKRLPNHLKNQLERAASSVALNLAEGHGKGICPDRLRFWKIALGSIRECEAVVLLESQQFNHLDKALLNALAGSVVKLLKHAPVTPPPHCL